MGRFFPHIGFLLVLAACQAPETQPMPVDDIDTLTIAERLADEGVARLPPAGLAMGWIETVWCFGLHRLYDAGGDVQWQAAYREWLVDEVPAFTAADPFVFVSSDTMSPALLASTLLLEDADAGVEPVVDAAHDYLDNTARFTAEGAYTHWSESNFIVQNDQVWVDSQFMFGLFLLREYERTGQRSFLDRFVTQYVLFSELCRDDATQLYRHAWDDSDQVNVPAEETFWARGNSWVLISAAEALAILPADDPAAQILGPLFIAHAQAVIELQQDDGLWRTVLNSPRGEDPDNYTETSASGLIAYALLRGTHSVLDGDRVLPVVRDTVGAIHSRIEEKNGELVLSGTSHGTNPGGTTIIWRFPKAIIYFWGWVRR